MGAKSERSPECNYQKWITAARAYRKDYIGVYLLKKELFIALV